jgi:hypothetical protein
VPLRTPPETGLRIGRGPGLGGGSESSFTTGTPAALLLTAGARRSMGAESSFAAEAEAEGNSAAFTGVFLTSRLLLVLGRGSVAGLFTGVAATGAAGCGVVAAEAGWTIFTMFSSR